MKEYLTVNSKSPASLLLDVTVHLELVVEFVCMYETQLLVTSVWHTQTLLVSYLYPGSINLPSLLFLYIVPQPAHPKISMILLAEVEQLFYLCLLLYLIMLGDFNFPEINWLNPDYNCPDASPLILFKIGYF